MRRLGLTGLLFLSITAAAQQPRTNETIEVSIVNLDVVVTDRQGNRVTGLTADDFEIREAGKLQPVTNFAEYGPTVTGATAAIEGTPSVEASPSPAPRAQRTIIVFVEWSRLAPFHAKEMYDAMRKLLRETVAPGDRVTIVSWAGGTVSMRQPFTDDLTAIESVLNVLEQEHMQGARDMSAEVRREQAEADVDAQSLGADSMSAGTSSLHVRAAAMRELVNIRQKVAVLEALMNGVAGVEGRKIMILAMHRFGVFAGAEYFSGGSVPLENRIELSTKKYHDSLIRTANATNVALYPIYAAGLKWTGTDSSERDGSTGSEADLAKMSQDPNTLANETLALDDIATRTGGLMAWGAANIAAMLPRVADDLETYYSLGYRAPETGKDRSRKIEVRMKNRDYRVRSRTQFVEKSDETQMKDRLVANLYQKLEGSSAAIPFDVVVGEYKSTGGKRWQLPLKIRIPIKALTTLTRGRDEVGEFSVYVVSGARLGVMSDVQHRSQQFKIPRVDLERARASYFTYDFALTVDEKVERLSIGVVDETAKEFGLKQLAVGNRTAAATYNQ